MKVQGTKIATLAGAVALALGSIASAQAAGFTTADGWNASFDGELHGFYMSTHGDTVGATSSWTDSRITSGFNPSKFNAHFSAPSYDGLKVTGNFQYANNITGGAAESAGGLDVRVLDINVAGSFGTVSIGRSWAIYDGSAIVAEEGTGGVGVGNLCLGTSQITANGNGGTCGRIGTGYTWTNFDARIEYDTPDMGGFGLRVGVFDGAGQSKTVNLGTTTTPVLATTTFKNSPRFEAEGTFAGKFDGGAYKVWLGTLSQTLSASANSGVAGSAKLSGTDFGARVDFGGFAVAGNVSSTKGFGLAGFKYGGIQCDGLGTCVSQKATTSYLDGSYKVSNTRFGVSIGSGKVDQDASTNEFKAKHNILYVHHNLTPQSVITVEYDTVKVDDKTAGTTAQKYNLWTAGLNYYF